MSRSRWDDPAEIRVKNDYFLDFPLWDDEGPLGEGELDISEGLTEDLRAFAGRWNASVPDDVFDDAYDHLPIVRVVVDLTRTVRWWANPGRRGRVRDEQRAIRRTGDELAARLRAELGEGFVVTYVH